MPIVGFYMTTGERNRAFYYLAAFSWCAIIVNSTKLSYSLPRPFWVNPDVQAFECTAQFGNPSGHAAVTVGRPMLYWLDLNKNVKEGLASTIWFKSLLFILFVLYSVSICYSRLFLGVHTLD